MYFFVRKFKQNPQIIHYICAKLYPALRTVMFIRVIVATIVLTVAAMAASARTAQAERPFTVVIDPGHGGKDYGCVGKLTNEKTIVLDVATRLGKLIADNHPEVRVKYTRDTDRFLSLQQRADVANNAHADLFISVHVNSVDKRSRNRTTVNGASVYTLGLHKSDNNLNVAMRENAVMELEPDYSATYQGFDPNSTESYIMFELNQNSHVANSLELASGMQKELTTTAGRADKSVRQAGFWVLWAVAMPSVLVELDFICNPAMERFLNSDAGKKKCATALSNAFDAYYARHRRSPEAAPAAHAAPEIAVEAPEEAVGENVASEPTYHVQFLTAPRRLAASDKRIKDISDVDCYVEGSTYKYYSGTFKTLAKAKKKLASVRRRYPDAFIIKMCGGQRI